MTEVVEHDDAIKVALYRPGVPLRVVVRGVLTRFLPASATIFGAFALTAVLGDPSRTWVVLRIMGLEVGALTLGFGVGLEFLRRHLYPDAAVDGRRSVVAGFASPLSLLIVSVFTQGSQIGRIATFSVVAGAGMALAMFFAWLRPTPGKDVPLVLDELPHDRGRLAGT
jgi:hypothetical protein